MIRPLPLALSLQDSAGGVRIHSADSSVASLQGDRITPIIQWFFQKAPWVMWGGVVIALVVLFLLLRWLWPRRQQIIPWIRTRSSTVKFALVGAAVVAVGLAATAGYGGYHFVETDKRFCNGCHIFVGSGQRFVLADSGNYTVVPMLEGKHDSLGCHTCHPLKPMKEAVKLIFWMSGLRDKEIPPHAKVPRKICEQCHVQGRAEDKEKWKAIAATAGHRAHLESDSSALKGKVECLTCHALIAHRFPPTDSTCGQSNCHKPIETRIVLGKMRGQGDFHCVGCHQFTARVPALATRDSAVSTLTPAIRSCFRCHAMQQRLPDFDERKDPHKGTCGMCHNPHIQTRKEEALKTCSTRECHGLWNQVPFHAGAQHRRKALQCTLCHSPHAARVDASDCVGCHQRVRDYAPGQRLFPPLPFDTSAALRRSAAPEPPPPADAERPSKVKGDAPPEGDPPGRRVSTLPALPSDSFPHPRHKKLACLTCHLSTSGQKLTFTPPRGCQICHHQDPTRAECTRCHEDGSLPEIVAVPVSIAAAGKPERERTVAFRHERHAKVHCTDCHGQPVSLAPVDSAISCHGCHDKHHDVDRDCSTCHRSATITVVHARPARVHVACDACHPTAAIAPLVPKRSFCLTCHGPAQDHYTGRECSSCHLQAHPEDYRARLLKRAETK
jgi:hypothetical protein